MDVDETWTDEESFHIDDPVSFFLVDSADLGDPSMFHANVRFEPRVVGTIEDSAVLQNKIIGIGCRVLARRCLGGDFARVCTGGQRRGASKELSSLHLVTFMENQSPLPLQIIRSSVVPSQLVATSTTAGGRT